jgi:hypothetical protein
MKIKITPGNAQKINARLKRINGRADSHTYTTYGDIEDLVSEAESQRCRLRLTKKQAVGMRVVCRSGETLPNAYKWSRAVTEVDLTHCATGWCLTNICSATAWGNAGGRRVILTPEMDAIAVQQLRSTYMLREGTGPPPPSKQETAMKIIDTFALFQNPTGDPGWQLWDGDALIGVYRTREQARTEECKREQARCDARARKN